MEAEPNAAEYRFDYRRRFCDAVDTLHQHVEDPGSDEFPFVEQSTGLRIELTGDTSVIFDLRGTATETPRRTRYSVGTDGRMYAAIEGQSLAPIGDVETQAVLGALEAAADDS